MKKIIITGSSNGIGKEIVKKFKKEKFLTIGIDIKKSNNCDLNILFDLENVDNIDFLINKLKQNNIFNIDGLINNAAIQIKSKFENISLNNFNKTLNVNLLAPFFLSQKLKPFFNKSSSIINISSIHAKQSKKNFLMYSTSKGALKTMTQNLALELAPNINVIGICPAAVDTKMLKSGLDKESYNKLKNYHPSKIIGDTKKLSNFIYLIFNNNHFLTGTNIEWDGGISKVLNDPESK